MSKSNAGGFGHRSAFCRWFVCVLGLTAGVSMFSQLRSVKIKILNKTSPLISRPLCCPFRTLLFLLPCVLTFPQKYKLLAFSTPQGPTGPRCPACSQMKNIYKSTHISAPGCLLPPQDPALIRDVPPQHLHKLYHLHLGHHPAPALQDAPDDGRRLHEPQKQRTHLVLCALPLA